MTQPAPRQVIGHVLCLHPKSNPLSVMTGKVYRMVEPYENEIRGYIRILDETDEDYPYPADWFVPIDLPDEVASSLDRVLATVEEAA